MKHYNKKKRSYIGLRIFPVLFLMAAALALFAAGCSSDGGRGRNSSVKGDGGEGEVLIYYLNRDDTAIGSEKYKGKAAAEELLMALGTDPSDLLLKRTLGAEVKLDSWKLSEGQLILDFEEDYRKLSRTGEVLFRACLVRTLCQAPEVDSVDIRVQGESITDTAGVPIGAMRADSFVDIGKGDEQAYDRAEFMLYYADKDGTKLVPEHHMVVYSTNVAMEKVIVEELIKGPLQDSHRATLSPDRIVKSISVKDGICYVDLTEPLLDLTGAVNEEVSVYSIVNSLTELVGINKVQISIDGESDRTLRGTMELDRPYERNTDIILEEVQGEKVQQ